MDELPSGTQTATVNTEHTLATDTSGKVTVLAVDLGSRYHGRGLELVGHRNHGRCIERGQRRIRPRAVLGFAPWVSVERLRTFAGHFKARQIGGARWRRVVAHALEHVGTVDAGRVHLDQHLAGFDDRHRALAQYCAGVS